MRVVVFIVFLTSMAFAQMSLKIAQYNVQNLFDLQKSGNEYEEYIPFGKSNWNTKTYRVKLNHIAKVLSEINADIVALEEIESLQALKDLQKTLTSFGVYYRYKAIANKKNTTVKVAFLSKIPPVYTKELWVTRSYKYRNILEAKFSVGKEDFYLFINHFKSKRAPESRRIVSAKVLYKRLVHLGFDKNIIVTGDFNSDYEEYKKFRRKRKLNDTNGKTALNHLLGTLYNQEDSLHVKVKPESLYNLWYDLANEQRWNYIHKKKKENLDSILISASLLDNKGLEYKKGSFGVYKQPYLFYKKRINSWYIQYRKNSRRHMAKGYSDHLPIFATFIFK